MRAEVSLLSLALGLHEGVALAHPPTPRRRPFSALLGPTSSPAERRFLAEQLATAGLFSGRRTVPTSSSSSSVWKRVRDELRYVTESPPSGQQQQTKDAFKQAPFSQTLARPSHKLAGQLLELRAATAALHAAELVPEKRLPLQTPAPSVPLEGSSPSSGAVAEDFLRRAGLQEDVISALKAEALGAAQVCSLLGATALPARAAHFSARARTQLAGKSWTPTATAAKSARGGSSGSSTLASTLERLGEGCRGSGARGEALLAPFLAAYIGSAELGAQIIARTARASVGSVSSLSQTLLSAARLSRGPAQRLRSKVSKGLKEAQRASEAAAASSLKMQRRKVILTPDTAPAAAAAASSAAVSAGPAAARGSSEASEGAPGGGSSGGHEALAAEAPSTAPIFHPLAWTLLPRILAPASGAGVGSNGGGAAAPAMDLISSSYVEAVKAALVSGSGKGRNRGTHNAIKACASFSNAVMEAIEVSLAGQSHSPAAPRATADAAPPQGAHEGSMHTQEQQQQQRAAPQVPVGMAAAADAAGKAKQHKQHQPHRSHAAIPPSSINTLRLLQPYISHSPSAISHFRATVSTINSFIAEAVARGASQPSTILSVTAPDGAGRPAFMAFLSYLPQKVQHALYMPLLRGIPHVKPVHVDKIFPSPFAAPAVPPAALAAAPPPSLTAAAGPAAAAAAAAAPPPPL